MAKPSRTQRPPEPKTPRRPTPPEAIPTVIARPTLDDHLDVITRAIFQAGLSWAIIASRWVAFRAAFEDFAVDRVAAYGEFDLERLMATDGIIHSAKKLSGTFANARALLAIVAEFGDVDAYAATFGSYAALLADARGRFAFMGDLSCYYWLFRTSHPVPLFEDWIAGQERDHPRMREMVLLGRSTGSSSERAGY